MNQKFEGMSKVQLKNGQVGFVISFLLGKYHLGKKPSNNCFHEDMGWFGEEMIEKTLKVYRKGRYENA